MLSVRFLLTGIIIAFISSFYGCGEAKPLSADAKTGNCPVCHMKVNANDDWESEILFKGGSKVMFESPADMVEYYLEPAKYGQTEEQKNNSNVQRVTVTDYSTKKHIDGRTATLVYKSNVQSPMGSDFVAFESPEAAAAFIKQHGGSIVTLNQVTEGMLRDIK